MRHIFLIVFVSSIITASSAQSNVLSNSSDKEPRFYHYSIWWAFVNKIYDGDLTVGRLKENGDMGLGSYSGLDGELVMNKGKLYQIREDGTVTLAQNDATVSYANATFFNGDRKIAFDSIINYETFRRRLNTFLDSKNIFYAFKVHGKFSYIKCGGLHRQKKPYTVGLDVLIPNRPVFEARNITGTMIGFFCPEFIGNINVSSYHFHFISDDEKFGGHVMDIQAQNLDVNLMKIYSYTFELPKSDDFEKVGFEKEFQYKSK